MKLFLSFICLLISAATSFSQVNLPQGALVLETRAIPANIHVNRQLVLWMLNPQKNPNNYPRDEVYTCPDYSRGSYYSGPLRTSLVDSRSDTIINTVIIAKDYEDGVDSFDIPYAIRKGYHYQVPPTTKTGIEVKPTIMRLQDYNGDGDALEFALFDAVACMGLQTSLIGYSKRQDKVISYPVTVERIEGSKHSTSVSKWADYLFSNKPRRPGYWKFEIDYQGRGGSLDKWEVRYVPTKEHFEARLTVIPGDQ